MRVYRFIYLTKNKINNKIYIGQKTTSDENYSPDYLGSGLILLKAIKKYGKKNFTRKILKFCRTKKLLDKWETYYIRKIYPQCTDRKYGYNISSSSFGGDVFTNNPNKEEIREKILKAVKGRKHTEKTKKKISRVQKGNTAVKGYKHFNNGIISIMSKECPKGFKEGRLYKTSKKTLNKMHKRIKELFKDSKYRKKFGRIVKKSKKQKNTWVKGRKWYNNGLISVMEYTKPKGKEWVKGRLTFEKPSMKNSHWYNNGVIQKIAKRKPAGKEWKIGRIK